ncbi:MAG: citramalate synthase [Desulfovibrionaceae bacterium]|jgi:2-isopropylmalate synthase|nr:citramalate synthase [Desulfovibrionaceae bacterium]
MVRQIRIYDTTLRDGTQAEDINLTPEDKIKIARKLDGLGVHYIEGGWPGSSPTDTAFFREIRNYELRNAVVAAFGSTHHPRAAADADPQLQALADSGAGAVTIFGKTWDIHATQALKVPLERNLEIIRDSVAWLKPRVGELFFDAEHFFDGFKANPDYAKAALRAAFEAGADALVLCDTNGGALPHEVRDIMRAVTAEMPEAAFGIHAHNDCELAVANSVAAVRTGAVQVQGTINGYGERCGNANLCSIVPLLQLKLGGEYECLPEGKLPLLTLTASYVSEVVNVQLFNRQPFVGISAFAHKGGVHVSAVARNSSLYEHMDPELVGNRQRILLSELAGRSNIVSLAGRYGFHLDKDEPVVKGLMAELKQKASLGYDYAAAEASVELLLFRKLARRGVRDFFKLLQFNVIEQKHSDAFEPLAEATVMIEVEGVVEHTAATGQGPVNALDNALKKALRAFYPSVDEMQLVDFKVRVLSSVGKKGTASRVRVLIESTDGGAPWVTVGVSHDIIEASWQALMDSVVYKLYKDEQQQRGGTD